MCTSIPSEVVTRATRIYSLRGSVGSVCSGRVHHVGPTSTSTSTSSHTLPPQSSPWVINNYSSQPCRGVLHAVPSLRHRGTPTVSIIKQAGYFFFFSCLSVRFTLCLFRDFVFVFSGLKVSQGAKRERECVDEDLWAWWAAVCNERGGKQGRALIYS